MIELRRSRVHQFNEENLVTMHELADAYATWKESKDDSKLLKIIRPVEETLSGFSNKAVIIIGAIFIISKSLVKTGFLEVIADKRKIIQVIVNLLDNAIRFTSESGKILISTSQNDGMVEVVVEDNGTGISAEEQKHVFERFYKVDTSRSGSGTGLGLAIAKHIVMAHEGNLLLDSQPGEGSKFSFKLRKT